ncbi:MAG: site-specific integrase [Bacteroides heparinolyticus]|nr:site-specific integrase [Bacteroides heparinolyticus]
MGRQKKQIVMKEPIRLREQVLKNGNRSLYLDIYHNGKRTYKFLKLYLVPEIDTPARIMNANTLAQANAIKEEMILDLTNSMAGIKDKSHKGRMPFCAWMGIYAENAKKNCAESSKRWVDRTVKEVTDYDSETTLANVDKEYLAGFMEHLVGRSAHNTDRKKLTKTTVFLYLSYVRAALNYAVRESVIPKSPFKGITRASLSIKEHKREYLTVQEIKRLIATPCHREDIKGAFLFSCFSGLRIYDIMNLRWKDIVQTATHWQVEIIQYKTGVELFLPLNMNARKWLPEKTGDTAAEDKIFPRLTRNYGQTLGTWMKNAGITKDITFHAGRHSFATLCLTAGIDIYTTSQLLGHTTIRHTQRYARIINTKKDEAVSLFDGVFE